jgi:hypothetical protein
MSIRRLPFFALVASLFLLCACQDTQRKPWVEQLDGGGVDAPAPPPDVPDSSDARPDIEVPPAPDCQQPDSSLSGQFKRLSDAEEVMSVTSNSKVVKASPNGCYVGFETPGGDVRIVDLTGDPQDWSVRNPAVGSDIGFQAMAFTGPEQHSAWFAASDGSIHLLSLDDFSQVRSVAPTRDLAEGFRFDYLKASANNRYLAWDGRAENPDTQLAGIYDLQSAVNVKTWQTRSGGGAPLEFVPGHSLVVVRTTANEGQIEIFDAEAGEEIRDFELEPLFSGNRSGVWAVTQSWLAVAHIRETGAVISRYDFDTRQTTLVDANPRGTTYHDLYASPSGRWLLEWNIQHTEADESGEAAVRRYELTGERPSLEFGHSFLGFGGATDLSFSRVTDNSGIEMYDPENGEALGTIGAFDGRNVSRVVGISANRLAVQWRDGNALKLSILTGSPSNR